MRCKIENIINITVRDIDLTTLSDIEFYVSQGNLSFQYTPEIVDSANMLVKIPFDDAKQLIPAVKAELQFAYTDSDGNKSASNIVVQVVQNLLKQEGYNPNGRENNYDGAARENNS